MSITITQAVLVGVIAGYCACLVAIIIGEALSPNEDNKEGSNDYWD